MDTRTTAPPEHPTNLKIGRELFRGRAADGEVVTFVCYDDGFGVRRGGPAVTDGRWDVDELDDALAAFRELTNLTLARRAAPPAA